MSINRVTITGNLTRDPELRATTGGTAVLGVGVAVNDRWRNPQTDQWEDRPNYIECVIFGNRATALANILRKGAKVAIEGRLRWSQWQDKETGKNRSKIEVVVDEVELMSQRGDNHGAAGGQPAAVQPPAYQAPAAAPAASVPPMPAGATPATPPVTGVFDADIPF